MQELEKILEEIENTFKENIENIEDENGVHHFVIDSFTATFLAKEIIRKHMNDGWIPVEEPPEDGQTVLCTDGEYVYLVEYDADLDAPFGDMDGITHWQPRPEPYRPASGTDKPDWRDGMLRKFDRRG